MSEPEEEGEHDAEAHWAVPADKAHAHARSSPTTTRRSGGDARASPTTGGRRAGEETTAVKRQTSPPPFSSSPALSAPFADALQVIVHGNVRVHHTGPIPSCPSRPKPSTTQRCL